MSLQFCGNPTIFLNQDHTTAAGHSDARRALCVSFSHRATVYPADGYDCRGPWMRVAVDSMRCTGRRIEQQPNSASINVQWTNFMTV